MLLSSIFAFNCVGQTWDIKADFPAAADFTIPYNGWTIGTRIVTSTLYPEGDYNYNTFSEAYSDVEETKPIYKLSSSSLAADSNIHAFINRYTEALGAPTRVQAYDKDGCVALRSYVDSVDPLVAPTERYDSYLRWTAPATGKYYIQLGVMNNGHVVKVTFSINGKPLEGHENIESTTTAAQRVSFFHPSYELKAGDVLEMNLQSAGATAIWKTTRLFGVITNAPEYILQDSFEDPALPGWTGATGGGVIATDFVRTGTKSVEFPWGMGADYRRMTLMPFAGQSDARNVELKVYFYNMPTFLTQYNGNIPPGLTEIDSKGAVLRVFCSNGEYSTMQILATTHQLAHTNPSGPVGWHSPPKPYALVKPEPGWNEYKIIANSKGHVTMYMNDIPVAFNPLMTGFRDIIIGQFKGADYEGPNVRTIFDDLEVKAYEKDEFESFPTDAPSFADPNMQKLHNILFLDTDLNRDYSVNFKDVAIMGQNWLAANNTSKAVSEGDIFFNMEYGNFRTMIDSMYGGWGRVGAALTTRKFYRSGSEAMSIPKGRFGRVWREFWAFNNNNCTVTAWLYYPANTYTGPLEINLLDENYNADTLLRVYAGYQYDPENPGLGTNVVKTAQGQYGNWVDSSAVVNTGWNKVQFVLDPENGTDVYFNSTLIRNFTPAEFAGATVFYIGKQFYYGTDLPDTGLIIFDDVSVFANDSGVVQGDPDAIYPAGEFNFDEQVDFIDLAQVAEHWLEKASLSSDGW